MKLDNVFPATDLRALSRALSKAESEQGIHPKDVTEYVAQGWTVRKRLKASVKVTREKELSAQFPDRVWTLLYRMGFVEMSGKGGAILHCRANDGQVKNQIDVVAIDADVALYIECRTAKNPHKVPKFPEDAAHIDGLRSCFQRAVKAQCGSRKVGVIYWSQNHILTDNDVARAAEKNVHLFDERELSYYEDLVRQIGGAARFQFLADVFGSARVDGLALKVPAVSVRLGPTRCFSFALSPEKLLKIAYVSHRAKGKSGDVDTYQRLLKRSRIKDIRGYVLGGGYFPTNIILNIRTRRGLHFDKAATPENVEPSGGDIGWLTLPAEYKAAWIIDGQHRLYAYADSEKAASAELTVLAFENLSESEQARLFVDINAKQKSVKQNLLMELWANLHWDSEDEDDRIRAIIAKLVLSVDTDPESLFFNKIIKADEAKTEGRSISLQALSSSLFQPDFFITNSKAGPVPGAFWSTDQLKTLRRARLVVDAWFRGVISEARSNWDLGKTEGGSLGMNDSVVALVLVLRSVVRFLTERGIKLYDLEIDELSSVLAPYAACVASFFGRFSEQDFSMFRSYRGVEGQTRRMREIQLELSNAFPEFNPDGLAEYLQSRDKNVMKEARETLDELEVALNRHVVGVLKAEYGPDEAGWWFQGVPKQIRARILQEINDEGHDSPKEGRFTLIDYRNIAQDKWALFKDTLAQGKNPGKDKGTAWIGRVNEIRKYAAHPTKGTAKPEDVQYLREQSTWLKSSLGRGAAPASDDERVDDEVVVE
jgi:DNA sulfur modification protein DndB